MSWAGAAPGALEAVGRSPSVQRESALAAPRSRESERTFWEWLDDLRIGVDYPGGDHLGRVSGAGLSVRDVSRSRLSLVLRSLVRKSTWLMRPPTLSRKTTRNYTVFDWLDQIPCWGTLLSSGLAILLPACGNNDAGEGQNCEMIINDHIIFWNYLLLQQFARAPSSPDWRNSPACLVVRGQAWSPQRRSSSTVPLLRPANRHGKNRNISTNHFLPLSDKTGSRDRFRDQNGLFETLHDEIKCVLSVKESNFNELNNPNFHICLRSTPIQKRKKRYKV